MNNPFPYSIFKEININGYKVVVFDWMSIADGSPDENRNVVCFDKYGSIVWQIERFPSYPGQYPDGACYYVGATLINDKLVLSNSCDLRVIVDYKTGKVMEKKEEKS